MQRAKLDKLRVVFVAIFILFTIFSITFATFENHHECSVEDCPICFVIEVAESNLKLLHFALAVFIFSQFAKFTSKKIQFSLKKSVFKSNTLISQKIRIND